MVASALLLILEAGVSEVCLAEEGLCYGRARSHSFSCSQETNVPGFLELITVR